MDYKTAQKNIDNAIQTARDNMDEAIMDVTSAGMSSCCGASVLMDICMDCKEHCNTIQPEQDEVYATAKSQTKIPPTFEKYLPPSPTL